MTIVEHCFSIVSLSKNNMKFLIVFVAISLAYVGLSEQACGAAFEQAFLHKHNEYRSHHGAAPLQLSAEINHWAQQWADHLASTGKFEHRPNNKYGENLFMTSSSAGAPHPNGDVAVTSWYNEKPLYHWFGKEPDMGNFHAWGHFTQLIWKGSHKVGVGCAEHGHNFVVVGNYDPHGNVIGQFHGNV